jgi:hypothetical protein
MGASGAGHGVEASPLAILGVAATKAEVLRGTFQGVLLEAARGRSIVIRGLCRGAPLCHNRLGPAHGHPKPCRRTIKMIKIIQYGVS